MIHRLTMLPVSAICPWLVLLWGLRALARRAAPKWRGWPRLALLGTAAAGILLIPHQGIPIVLWLRGLNANFSIPFLGLLAVAVWEGEFGRKWFSKADWAAAWVFGSVAGFALYPLALGWGRFDPYEWGWRFGPLFVAIGVLTALLLWKQNRFGFLLLLAIAAWHLRLLESVNYWDYLLDPVYCLASLLAVTWQLVARGRRGDLRGLPPAVP
jgi:hypothetical protein